jgi:alkyl hydroperoxide reductase subunit F
MGEGSKASLSSFEYLLAEGDRLEELFYGESSAELAVAS